MGLPSLCKHSKWPASLPQMVVALLHLQQKKQGPQEAGGSRTAPHSPAQTAQPSSLLVVRSANLHIPECFLNYFFQGCT